MDSLVAGAYYNWLFEERRHRLVHERVSLDKVEGEVGQSARVVDTLPGPRIRNLHSTIDSCTTFDHTRLTYQRRALCFTQRMAEPNDLDEMKIQHKGTLYNESITKKVLKVQQSITINNN